MRAWEKHLIDVHSHVLPCVDDGSDSLQVSLKMVEKAVNEGVTDLFLTPHNRGAFDKTPKELKEAFDNFCESVKAEGIKVNLYLGQEIFVTKEIKKKIVDGEVLSLNDSKYMLIEPDYNECEITEVVYELTRLGYKPIVAHVERFSYITIDDLFEIKQLGGFVQVNASAVIGKDYRINAKLIKQAFKEGLVDFVASDVHSNRENCMAKAYALVKRKYGIGTADAVFIHNAKEIINGQA